MTILSFLKARKSIMSINMDYAAVKIEECLRSYAVGALPMLIIIENS